MTIFQINVSVIELLQSVDTILDGQNVLLALVSLLLIISQLHEPVIYFSQRLRVLTKKLFMHEGLSGN
jgi:hypothetical protein